MGAANVKAVYELWPALPGAAFRTLAYMALVSKDADSPPRYWGGREDLAAALGREVPPENEEDADVTRQRNAAFKAVRDATSLLTKLGAIVLLRQARGGQRQEWALNLRRGQVHGNRAPETAKPSEQVHENRAPEVHENRAARCTDSVAQAHENRAPKEEKEDRGEQRISQSAYRQQARAVVKKIYNLTDHEAVLAVEAAEARCPDPSGPDNPAAYIASFKDGEMAAIVEAIWATTRTPQERSTDETGGFPETSTYRAGVQPPNRTATNCDQHPNSAVDPAPAEGWGSCLVCNTHRRRNAEPTIDRAGLRAKLDQTRAKSRAGRGLPVVNRDQPVTDPDVIAHREAIAARQGFRPVADLVEDDEVRASA